MVCGLKYDEPPVLFSAPSTKPADGVGGSGSGKKARPEPPAAGSSYKGQELHRFPKTDHSKERPLPGHLWVFLFSAGVQLEEHSLPPRFFVNALTYSDGTRSYVISIKFYEKTYWPVKPKRANNTPTLRGSRSNKRMPSMSIDGGGGSGGSASEQMQGGVLYAPKAICIVTQLPLFSFFKSYLSELFLLSQPSSTSSNVPLERYISQLVIPIPLSFSLDNVFDRRFALNFRIGKSTIPCVLPNLVADFCITDVSFRYLFQALSVDTVITLLAALLTEQKILFHSQHYVLLITALQSLIDLLLPFQWPHTYIPTVPSNLLEFVDAPTPYVMGVHASQMETLGPLEDVIVVDCDRNSIRLPSFFVPLPADLQAWMTGKLNTTLAKFGVSQKSKDYVEAEMEKIDLAFATSYQSSSSDAEFTLELRMCTMSLFARMFYKYEKYLNKNSHGIRGRTALFDEPAFTASRDPHHRAFVSECACRSVFEMFLSSPEPKLFGLFSRYVLEYPESEVFLLIENARKTAPLCEVDVPPPEPSSTICSYSHFPELDHSRYAPTVPTPRKAPGSARHHHHHHLPQQQHQQPHSGGVADETRIYSDISRKVRGLVTDGSAREKVTIVDTLHTLLKGMHDEGETDMVLAARAEAWFRGAVVDAQPEVFEKRSRSTTLERMAAGGGGGSGSGSGSGSASANSSGSINSVGGGGTGNERLHQSEGSIEKLTPLPSSKSAMVKEKMWAMAKKLTIRGATPKGSPQPVRQPLTPAMSSKTSVSSPSVIGAAKAESVEEGGVDESVWKNPDSWDNKVVAPESLTQRETSRECMLVFVQILRFYGEAGEVRFSRSVFRDLCRLLRVVVWSCDAGLKKAKASGSGSILDVNSSTDDEDNCNESGVVGCWACGEMNRADYLACKSCAETPLGVGRKTSDQQKQKQQQPVQVSPLLYQPKGEEKAYFDILKSVVVVAGAIYHSSSEGYALQQFSVEKEGWAIWSRSEFWQYCIFSDYCEKAKIAVISDPRAIPAYPDLFPLAAFYANAMVSARVPRDLAVMVLERLPVDSAITATLSQLSSRLYESVSVQEQQQRAPLSTSASLPAVKGVRVVSKGRLKESRRFMAAQMTKVATGEASAEKRPPPPSMSPRRDRRMSLTMEEV